MPFGAWRGSNRLFRPHRGDPGGVIAKLGEDFLGVLAEQRRALHVGGAVGHLDRIADRQVLAARRMIDFDDGAGLPQRWLLREFLHRQDRAARDVVLVQDVHRLELALGLGPLLDSPEDRHQPRQPRLGRRVIGMGNPILLADHLADLVPYRCLGDEVDIGIVIVLPALAFEDPARLPAARGIAGAWHRLAELAVGILRKLLERAMGQALLVAQFDAAEVEHAVLHGRKHLLAAPGGVALVERGDDAEGEMETGAGIADLRAGDQRRAVVEAGGRGGATGALGDVLVDLAILVGTGTEALDRSNNHARVQFLDALPGEAHAIEHAGGEILHQHVAMLDQRLEHLFALGGLGVEGDRALVVVEHGEIEAVDIGNVAQLAARDVADAGTLYLDHVGAEPGKKLGAGWPGLHMGEVEDADAIKCLAHFTLRNLSSRFRAERHTASCRAARQTKVYFLRSTLCGLRLPMRPLSLPAAGSITALMRVGLPESMAASTARFNSSGVVAWTPTPPNASIILS